MKQNKQDRRIEQKQRDQQRKQQRKEKQFYTSLAFLSSEK